MDTQRRRHNPCIDNACEECVDALLSEHGYHLRGSAFEQAAEMARGEAAGYFMQENDEMARSFRAFAKGLDDLAKIERKRGDESPMKMSKCTKPQRSK